MENKWTILVEIQFDGMEQKRKGNGMGRENYNDINKWFLETEWNGNGKGMESYDIERGMLPLENFDFFVNSTWNRSIQFHSIPWNSTFHFKMPTSDQA